MSAGERAHRLSDLLHEHADRLITRWAELAGDGMRGRLTTTELNRELGELFTMMTPIADNASGSLEGEEYGEIRAMLAEISRSRARQGASPTETASSVFALKRAVFELGEQYNDPGLFRELMVFFEFLDTLGLWTFETYAAAREEIIKEQSEQLLELTTPVVKLWEGVLAVPLVGTLDSARTQVVMEKLLETLVETNSEHAIIDITGVLAVDTQVAQHLLKTVVAARLMGAECIISGIRPQIAQTIVGLGIEFGDIMTKASLADALRHALRRDGFGMTGRPV